MNKGLLGLIIILSVIILLLIINKKPKYLELTYSINAGIPFKWEVEIEDETVAKLKKSYVTKNENKGAIVGGKVYTKYIGVSNFNVQSLLNLISFCKIKPAVNEIEFHPYLYQKKLADFCKKEEILLFGYNPLVRGCYSSETCEEKDRDLLGEKIIVDLAKKYKKTVGQIVLNWSIAREVIPIPMTSNPRRMIENLGSTDFSMDIKDYEKIDGLNRNQRFGRSEIWNIYDDEVDVFA